MKKELAIGICFGLAGILCTCLFGYEYFTTYGFLNAYHMKAFAASDTGYLPLLANILWERGKVFVIIAILSLTALKAILPLLLRCLIYFTGGVFFAACVMNMGILGIVFFLVSWLPHGILYLAALALLLLVEPHRFYNQKNPSLPIVFSMTSLMPKKEILSFKNAATTTSFAALTMQGIFPA